MSHAKIEVSHICATAAPLTQSSLHSLRLAILACQSLIELLFRR